jgi:hypothetical protein
MDKRVVVLLVAKLLERVGPEDVTHEAVGRRFPEAVDLWALSVIRTHRRSGGRTVRRSSRVLSSGERPPWMQRNCLFMTAASGRAQKDCTLGQA